MKGFHFRLESVLALRRHREESLQCRLAESERALEAETARLEAIDRQMKTLAKRVTAQQRAGALDVSRLMIENSYLMRLEKERAQQAIAAELSAQQVARDREAVIQASRDKRALETVREGLLTSFVQENARTEQKAADEMATTRHVLGRLTAQRS